MTQSAGDPQVSNVPQAESRASRIAARAVSGRWSEGQIEHEIDELLAAQLQQLRAHAMPDGLKCRDLGECYSQHQQTEAAESALQQLRDRHEALVSALKHLQSVEADYRDLRRDLHIALNAEADEHDDDTLAFLVAALAKAGA